MAKFIFLRWLNSHSLSINELCHEQGVLTLQFHEHGIGGVKQMMEPLTVKYTLSYMEPLHVSDQ